jgi:lysophospholipase L1-like esterase
MTREPLYLADFQQDSFQKDRTSVDVVCAGDSITGWNNNGPVRCWPFPTYPQFLQSLCAQQGLRIADGGIAGEISDNGLGHVRHYLDLFPNSRYFIIGFGTNDLGMWPDLESTSKRIIDNLGGMVQAVRDQGKLPILFNVPYANESAFPPHIAEDTHARRDFHNERLRQYCDDREIPLTDVCSHLRDEHFGDELHPNESGAKIIAEEVFNVFCLVHGAGQPGQGKP